MPRGDCERYGTRYSILEDCRYPSYLSIRTQFSSPNESALIAERTIILLSTSISGSYLIQPRSFCTRMTVLFGATLRQYFRKVLSTQECPVRALLSLGLRLSAQIACRNRAIHDDIIELSKRLRCADGEVFHHEPTAPCCHRFGGFRRPAANGDYPADCTERHPGANCVNPI